MANLPKNIQNTSFRASLPAGAVAQAGFRNEAKICQTTTCTIHDMERRKMQLYENNQLVKTRIYCGMYEKETDSAANVKQYCYIAGGNGVTAVLINEDLYFLRRDVQGTITGLIDKNDTLVEEYSYDAWGRRRNPTNWTYDSVPQPQYMHRGYTMHEMLDEFGLINMNGRCYDPVVGRFLSPDIVVQNPNNTQCYNRYSYAVNNPLKYTDPSGWSYSPSVRWRSSFNGMQRRAIDLIYSKTWKPGELNELAGLLDMAGGNSLNNAGAPLDICDQQLGAFKLAIGNMEKISPITLITKTIEGENGSYESVISVVQNDVILANLKIKGSIEGDKERIEYVMSTSDKANSISGFILTGLEYSAKESAKNFIYSAGLRLESGRIISKDVVVAANKLSLNGLATGFKVAGRVAFGVGLMVSLYSMVNNPTAENIAAGLCDITFSAAATFGGYWGVGAALIYYGIKYTVGWDTLFDLYVKYPPSSNPFFVPYY